MKHTNSALNFQLAQYRAIFSDPLVVKGLASALVISAGAAACYAQTADASALDSKSKWDNTLKSGNFITITGEANDSGQGGKYTNITISADSATTRVDLKPNQRLLITDTDHPYSSNYFKAEGANKRLTVYGGVVEVGEAGDAAGKVKDPGLQVLAKDGGVVSLIQSRLSVNSELHISNSGANSRASVAASNIIIGNGTGSQASTGTPSSRVVAGETTNGKSGEGSTQFGASYSRITVNKDAELDVVANGTTGTLGTGTFVDARNVSINGGALRFQKGTDRGFSSFNALDANLNDGYMRVDSGSNATLRNGTFNVNGNSNVEIGSEFTLNNNQKFIVDDSATLAASSGSSNAQLTLYNNSTVKLSKAKLKEFLTGLKEDGSHVQYIDIAESDPSKQIKTAGQGTLDINASIVLTDQGNVDLANEKDFKFSETKQQGAITSGYDGKITAQNLTVSKAVTGASKLTVESNNLTLGSDNFVSSSSSLGVRRFFANNVEFKPYKDTNNYTLKDHVILSGNTGSIKGNVSVDGGRITITGGGKYELEQGKSLVLDADRTTGEAGSALTIDDGSLAVSGKVHATDKGSIQVKNGRFDASKASSLKIANNSIKLGENAALIINGNQVLELKDPQTVSFHSDAFSEHAIVSSDESAVSTLTMTNLGSMNVEQYRDLKQKTGYNGFFNGFDITGTDAQAEMDYAKIESGTPDSIYRNTEVSVTGPIDKPISVGRVEVSTGSLSIQEHPLSGGKKTGNLVKLTNADANGGSTHNFVQTTDGKLAGVELDGKAASLQLQGAGNIGSIEAKAQGNGNLYIGSPDRTASANVTVQGDIGKTQSLGELTVQASSDINVTGDTVNVDNLQIRNGSSLTAQNAAITVASGSSINGDLTAKELKLTAQANNQITTYIEGNGTTNVDQLTATKDTILQIGKDGREGLNGTLLAKNMTLSGGTIYADPDFDAEASYAVINNLSGGSAPNDAGTLDGNAVVGKNAVVAIGFENKNDVVSIIKNKLNGHGAFVEGSDVQNALVLNKKITLADGKKIIIDSESKNPNQYLLPGVRPGQPQNQQPAGPLQTNQSDVTLGANSALVITDEVFDSQNGGSKTGSAITLTKANAKVDADNGGVVILSGRFSEADQNIQIFSASGTGTLAISKDIQVQTANGLLAGTVAKGSSGQVQNLKVDTDRLRNMFRNTSKPVADMLENALVGKDPTFYEDPNKAGAQFVAQVATDSQTAVELDSAVHAASYAGAQQAAIDTSNAMTNAMMDRGEALNANREGRKLKDIYTQAYYKATAERKGNKVEVTTPTLASNTNTGVWATPTYVNTKADGYEAENASYGADIDIKGVTVGADTLVGNATIGVAASIGTGKADGNGQGKGLKDDFDYYGLGAYTAMSFGQFSLIGDTSVTAMKHDISGASGIQGFGNLSSSVDSLAISAGVTGKYKFETPYMDVTPHFGTRFLHLSTDSYDLYSDGKRSNLMNTDYDAQNIFSFPVGVSLSKQYHVGGWILNPDVDLTLTVNAGDTDAKSSSKIYGVKDPLDLTTQVMDDVTYRAKVGFGVTNGNFNTNINFHYTGSENTESYGINANVGYDF